MVHVCYLYITSPCVWKRIASRIKGRKVGNYVFVAGVVSSFLISIALLMEIMYIAAGLSGIFTNVLLILNLFLPCLRLFTLLEYVQFDVGTMSESVPFTNHTVVFNSKIGLYLLCGSKKSRDAHVPYPSFQIFFFKFLLSCCTIFWCRPCSAGQLGKSLELNNIQFV